MALRIRRDESIAHIAFTDGTVKPIQVRAHLHALIDQLTEEALFSLWHFVCLWVTPHRRRRPPDADL
jgi:hypothetical protein